MDEATHRYRIGWLRREAVRFRKSRHNLALANLYERLADTMQDGVPYSAALKMIRGFYL